MTWCFETSLALRSTGWSVFSFGHEHYCQCMAAFSLCEEALTVAAYVAQVVLSNGVCAVISYNVVDAVA